MSPFFAHIVGVAPDQHAVVCGTGREFFVRRKKGKTLVVTNHFIGDEHEHLNGPDEEIDAQGNVWTYDTRPRYEALERRLRRLPTSLNEAMQKLGRSPVTTGATQQQMVLCPSRSICKARVRGD